MPILLKKRLKKNIVLSEVGLGIQLYQEIVFEITEKLSIARLTPKDGYCSSLEAFGRIIWLHHQTQFFILTIDYVYKMKYITQEQL